MVQEIAYLLKTSSNGELGEVVIRTRGPVGPLFAATIARASLVWHLLSWLRWRLLDRRLASQGEALVAMVERFLWRMLGRRLTSAHDGILAAVACHNLLI